MKATVIKLDVQSGMNVVTLYVQDVEPFRRNFGKYIELTAADIEQPPMEPPAANTETPPPANVVPFAAPNNNDVLKKTERYMERPVSTSGPMGAANAGNPNACGLCYGHGLVKEFRGDDMTGVPATCKECSGTGIKPAEKAEPAPVKEIKPCDNCKGTGVNPEEAGQRCPTCDGTGTAPATA